MKIQGELDFRAEGNHVKPHAFFFFYIYKVWLLEATGISTVTGSGFGQKEG
ncbi:putative transaminase [Helianthus annuus]|nr:putative transaminase [Helianthus annuus]